MCVCVPPNAFQMLRALGVARHRFPGEKAVFTREGGVEARAKTQSNV